MEAELVRWGVTGLMGIVVWFLKKTLDDTQRSLEKHTQELAEIRRDYLHRDDFKEFKTELRSMFDEIKADIRDIKNEKNHLAR